MPRWPTPAERFWVKVDKSGPVHPTLGTPCWLWTGATVPEGYGVFTPSGKALRRAHRVAYEWSVGPIPEGLELDHLCRVRACVNPAHLEPVTHRENQRRGFGAAGTNARKTHCPKGHPYAGGNLVLPKDGGRRCRECVRQSNRKPNRAPRRRSSAEA